MPAKVNVLPLFCLLLAGIAAAAPPENHKTQNIIFVMTDGLRWQEVFRGADAALMNKELGGVTDIPALKQRYWRESAKERRELLMPFL